MGQLTNQYVSQSYQGILNLENANTGITPTLQYVTDGLGNKIPLQLSNSEVLITGSLYVKDLQTNTGFTETLVVDSATGFIYKNNITGSTGSSGTSGTSGSSGSSGTSGVSGTSGSSGSSGTSGTSGSSGSSGTSGSSGSSGSSGTSGVSGTSGSSGSSGSSGTSGTRGTSGTSGSSGSSGSSGTSGGTGSSGSSGTSGTSGSSGISGDKYLTSSTTSFTLGNSGTITVGTGLAYSPAQGIIIVYDASNYQESSVISYNSGTGDLQFGAPTNTVGSGTYTAWTVNLAGASGGDGSSGTSGTSGTSGVNGTSGTSGINGTSGSSGTSGISGTDGTSGSSGSSGSSGTSGVDGTSGSSGSSGTSGTSPIIDTSMFATTGSNVFIGDQDITGNVGITGSLEVLGKIQSSGSFANIVIDGNNDFYVQNTESGAAPYIKVVGPNSNEIIVLAEDTGVGLKDSSGNFFLFHSGSNDSVQIANDTKITGSLAVSNVPSGSTSSNIVTWNSSSYEFEYTDSIPSSSYAVTSSIAFDVVVYGKCDNPSGLLRGTVVRITGANGDNPLFNSASWEDDSNSANTLGVLSEDVAYNAFANIVVQGKLIGINTSGFTPGDMIYLSSSGQYTTQSVPAPYHEVRLGQVLRVNQNQGSMYVNIDNGYELQELHDVDISGVTAGDLLIYRSGSYGQWVNESISEIGLATTGSNVFKGDQTISGSLTNRGNLFIVHTGTTEPSYISQSAESSANLIFRWDGQGSQLNKTGSFIISGSNNIILTDARNDFNDPVNGFSGYAYWISGSNNIILGGDDFSGIAFVTSSSARPRTNYNLLFNAPMDVRLTSSSLAQPIIQSNQVNNSVTLYHESGSFTYQNNLNLSFIASNQNVTRGTTVAAINNNAIIGAVTLNHFSSSITYANNVGGGLTINNHYSSSVNSAANNRVSYQNNMMEGANNLLYVSGSPSTNQTRNFNNNLIGGSSNIISSSYIGSNNAHLIGTAIWGQNLIVSASHTSTVGGTAFFGRYNGINNGLDSSQNIVFAVGTGTGTSNRRTGFWIDSGSNVNVSGSLSVNGIPVQAVDTGSFATTGSNVFKGNQTVSGSIEIASGSQLSTGKIDGLGGTSLFVGSNVDIILACGGIVNVANTTNITGSLNVSSTLNANKAKIKEELSFTGSRFASDISSSLDMEMLGTYQFGFNQNYIGDSSTGTQFLATANKDSNYTEVKLNTRYTGQTDAYISIQNSDTTPSLATIEAEQTSIVSNVQINGNLSVTGSIDNSGSFATIKIDGGNDFYVQNTESGASPYFAVKGPNTNEIQLVADDNFVGLKDSGGNYFLYRSGSNDSVQISNTTYITGSVFLSGSVNFNGGSIINEVGTDLTIKPAATGYVSIQSEDGDSGISVNPTSIDFFTDGNNVGYTVTLDNTGLLTAPAGVNVTGTLTVVDRAEITGSVHGNVETLGVTSNTASLDLDLGNFFTLQLIENDDVRIEASNIKPGQTVNLLLYTTGSGTVTFDSQFKQPSGSAYVPTTTTGTDILTLVSYDNTTLYVASVKDFV